MAFQRCTTWLQSLAGIAILQVLLTGCGETQTPHAGRIVPEVSFQLERKSFEGVWEDVPDDEGVWADEQIRYRVDLKPAMYSKIVYVRYLKHDPKNPADPGVEFGRTGPGERYLVDPKLDGHWQVSLDVRMSD